ncbi:MAG: flagellar biosynthetic protein FliR [Hyphomicrobiaceae bacterium]
MRLADQVFELFLVFCRIGTCLMLVPGLSTARVPARVRLYLAITLSLVVAPLVGGGVDQRAAPIGQGAAIMIECVIGALLGLVTRLFMEALEFAGTVIANYIGLIGMAATPDGDDQQPTVTNLVTTLGLMLLLVLDLPQHLVMTLVWSYTSIPPGVVPDAAGMLRHVVDTLSMAFLMALRVTAPFLIYAVVVNLAFGVLGKLVPQVPSFAISAPFIALGGLLLLFVSIGDVAAVINEMIAEAWARYMK